MNEDIGALADKLKSMLDSGGADKLLDLIGGGESGKKTGAIQGNNGMDIDTIMKLKKAYDTVNSRPDPRVSLLASLRPYLNNHRAAELDKIVNLLSITKISDVMKTFKGGF